jgi:hypothetical protein
MQFKISGVPRFFISNTGSEVPDENGQYVKYLHINIISDILKSLQSFAILELFKCKQQFIHMINEHNDSPFQEIPSDGAQADVDTEQLQSVIEEHFRPDDVWNKAATQVLLGFDVKENIPLMMEIAASCDWNCDFTEDVNKHNSKLEVLKEIFSRLGMVDELNQANSYIIDTN